MRPQRILGLVVLAVLCLAGAAVAQDVGRLVDLDGTVEIVRSGAVLPASVGSAVHVGDVVRTRRPGGARLVLGDGSVLNLGTETALVIDDQVFRPAGGVVRSIARLLQGTTRALVGHYYNQPDAVYELNTPTAVVGVRGTEFVVVFDPIGKVTDVLGVTGTVVVYSALDRVKNEVVLGPRELTVVAAGRYPTAPIRVPDALYDQYLEGLDFIGQGQPESLTVSMPSVYQVPPPWALPPEGPAATGGGTSLLGPGGGGAGFPQFPVAGNGPRDGAHEAQAQPPGALPVNLTGDLGVKF
jgi:hypothetical protein